MKRARYEIGVYYELRDLADHLNGVGHRVEVVAVDTSRRPMVVLFKVLPS